MNIPKQNLNHWARFKLKKTFYDWKGHNTAIWKGYDYGCVQTMPNENRQYVKCTPFRLSCCAAAVKQVWCFCIFSICTTCNTIHRVMTPEKLKISTKQFFLGCFDAWCFLFLIIHDFLFFAFVSLPAKCLCCECRPLMNGETELNGSWMRRFFLLVPLTSQFIFLTQENLPSFLIRFMTS